MCSLFDQQGTSILPVVCQLVLAGTHALECMQHLGKSRQAVTLLQDRSLLW